MNKNLLLLALVGIGAAVLITRMGNARPADKTPYVPEQPNPGTGGRTGSTNKWDVANTVAGFAKDLLNSRTATSTPTQSVAEPTRNPPPRTQYAGWTS